MSNFICSECGMTHIDCGHDGYKTSREIELEKKLNIACSVIRYILDGELLPSRIEILEFANKANEQIKEVKNV